MKTRRSLSAAGEGHSVNTRTNLRKRVRTEYASNGGGAATRESVSRRGSPRKRAKPEPVSEGASDGRGATDTEEEELQATPENIDHEEEKGAAETEEKEEAPAVVQNGEKETNDILTHIESVALKKKPMLVLSRIEGDFHLLLNDAVLPQKDNSVESEETAEKPPEDSFVPEESEPQEATLPQDDLKENEEEDAHTTEDTSTLPHTEEETVQENGIDSASKEEQTEETNEPQDENCENEPEVMEDTPNAAEEEPSVELKEAIPDPEEEIVLILENVPQEKIENELATEESCEPQEETLPQVVNSETEVESMLMEDAPRAAEEPTVPTSESTKDQEDVVPSPAESTDENIQNEIEIEAIESLTSQQLSEEVTSFDVIVSVQDLPQQLLTESPPREDSPLTIMCEPSAPTTEDLELMDLQQLKREKLKIQIKVLKLQEEYYSLQLKKLNQ